jgi:hypothetical protein
VKDNVTLPIQRLREAVSELVKLSDDKDIGQELVECNRRLGELKVEVAEFLSQQADDHVYWVERGGKSQRNLSLNAAPVDVAEFLRRRLFESDTSVIMTSATLATSRPALKSRQTAQASAKCRLNYFSKRVGCESATHAAGRHAVRLRAADEIVHRQKNARPARGRLRRRAGTLDRTFRQADARQGVRAVHQLQAHAGSRGPDAAVF